MPQLPTSQAYLEQSALLLQAYPDTRITTKYFYPTERRAEKHKREKSQAKKSQDTATPAAPVASLVLKTYHPATGIVLKYQTNKLQEVGRLMTSLGKLAAGADVAALGLSGPAADVEMVDVGAPVEEPAAAAGKAGGKGKKKGGKGKR